MKRIAIAAALTAVLTLAASGGAWAQSTDELRKQLDQSMKIIQDLQERVKALEQKLGPPGAMPAAVPGAAPVAKAPPPAQPAAAEAVAASAPVVAPTLAAEAGTPNASKARLEISGQVMLDAIYDFKRVDPAWNATLRPSTIPVNCPGDAGCGKHGETVFSIRQSKIGFKGYLPTPKGELSTLLEMDLFDSGGGNTHIRVLSAWAELGWFGVGQHYTTFMDADTFPNTVDYWGPSGMVYVRNPQLRMTPFSKDGVKLAFSLEAPGAALDTGKISDIDPALGANVTSRNRYPDIVGSFRLDRDWGHVQAAGIYRRLSFETPSNPNSEPSGTKSGYGLNLAGSFNTFGKNRIAAAFVFGKGIASYMNDGGTDLAPNSSLRAEAVKSYGWFAYYDHYWSDLWSSSIGYSEHHQDNTGGQLPNAFRKGSYGSVNLLWYPVKNVTTGAELLWGKLEHNNGDTGKDNRIQFSTKYAF